MVPPLPGLCRSQAWLPLLTSSIATSCNCHVTVACHANAMGSKARQSHRADKCVCSCCLYYATCYITCKAQQMHNRPTSYMLHYLQSTANAQPVDFSSGTLYIASHPRCKDVCNAVSLVAEQRQDFCVLLRGLLGAISGALICSLVKQSCVTDSSSMPLRPQTKTSEVFGRMR